MAKNVRRDTLVWGIILIVLGAIFLLDTLDVEVWDSVARFWPVIIIFWGAWKLYFGLKEKAESGKPEKPGLE